MSDNDRIFVSTSYMDGSAAISWAAANYGILSPDNKDAFSGELLVHMDGVATLKWWDGPSPDEQPFVLVIDPERTNGSYVTVYESEDQPPNADAPVAWKFGATRPEARAAQNALLREIIRRALDGITAPDGAILTGPIVATEAIMRAIDLSDGGEDE